jgi:hypothetical protein
VLGSMTSVNEAGSSSSRTGCSQAEDAEPPPPPHAVNKAVVITKSAQEPNRRGDTGP